MCALWIPAHVEHSVISLSHVKLNTALVEVNAAALMGQYCFIIRVSNLLHELLIRLNEIEREETQIQQPLKSFPVLYKF